MLVYDIRSRSMSLFLKMNLYNLHQRENQLSFFIALSAALLIAATESSFTSEIGLIGSYLYWIVRILTEALLFIAFRDAVERYLLPRKSIVITGAIAYVFSLFPFVLSITAFDLILGYPELGLEGTTAAKQGLLKEFALEILYLSDNHIALCFMLSAPRLLKLNSIGDVPSKQPEPRFMQSLDPKLSGDLLWIKAQEHYAQIVTTKESRTVLYRFSDLVRDLETYPGMQIHRSHWVAYAAVAELEKSGQTMKVMLTTGESIPVSRTYRSQLEKQMASY